MSEALLRLRRMRHDVRALCLQTQAEADASFPKGSTWRDPEQGDGVFRFDAATAGAYAANRDEHFARVKGECRKNDIAYLAATIEQPLASVLRAWLRLAGRA